MNPAGRSDYLSAMRLIVGLGNPGRQYDKTPHNVGFEVVDLLASRRGATWAHERRFEAETADIMLSGVRLTLMKPLTFMNLSGRAVGAWASKNGGEPAEILAITDDFHLSLGRLRLRPDGSHGGHKGLLSMINTLGTLGFPRLRMGVRPAGETLDDTVGFVLGKFRPAEREVIERAVDDAADCVELLIARGMNEAMNKYNRMPAPRP